MRPVKLSQPFALEYDKMTSAGEPDMFHVKRFLALFLITAGHLAAQANVTARRPGGGAGMDYKAYDAATLERGKTTFSSQCGFCHGANARGGEGGPDLLRAEIVLDDENGNLIGPVILNGRPGGMPKFTMNQTQIGEIAAFLHEGIRAAAERGTYKVLNIVTGDPKAGETYFNGAGKCGTCHSPAGDLKGVGSKYDPIALQGRFLMPAGGRGAQPKTVVIVTLSSGRSVQGTLQRIDDFNVALTDSNGDYHSFQRNGAVPKVELKDPLQAHYDLLSKYTDGDIHNLTAWLVTLK
jgi:cytochrome c oxidase cbb3-type subunit III